MSVVTGAARDAAALLQHQHVRGEPHDILEIVRDEDQRHVERPAQRVDLVLETPAHRAIDGGKRLVEQQHGRLASQRSRERDALTLAARQLVRSPGHAGRTGAPASAALPRGARRSARGRCPSAVITLPDRGQVRKERVLLEDEPDRAAMRRRERPGGGVGPGLGARSHRRLRRSIESRDRAQDRRLAAAGRAEDRQHVARVARELDVERDRTRLTKADRQAPVSHGEDPRDATAPSSPSAWPPRSTRSVAAITPALRSSNACMRS